MYSLFLRNIQGFLYQVEPNSYTDKCFEPIKLLGNTEEFLKHRNENSDLYKNAKLLIDEVNKLKATKKYHRVGVLLRELEGEGIVFDNTPADIKIEDEVFREQISLLWQ